MITVVTRALTWSLGFVDPRWSLVPKTQIPIDLYFDGGPATNVIGTVMLPQLVNVPMPDNSTLISVFRRSSQLRARAQGQWFLFNLDGTSRLLVQLVQCVKFELAEETGQHLPPAVEPQGVPTAQDTAIEEERLATNFLLAAQLPGAHLLAKTEIPVQLASYGAVWKAGTAMMGAVKIYAAQPQLSGLTLASQIIASDAEHCKGKFVSARYNELVDDKVVVRAATTCADSEGQADQQYYIAPRDNGFVAFSVVATASSERQELAGDQQIQSFRKAALTAATEH
jgi:hypothetical protein